MIYGLLILMTVLVGVYIVAWFVSPSLRELLEKPNQSLLKNGEKFEQIQKCKGSLK